MQEEPISTLNCKEKNKYKNCFDIHSSVQSNLNLITQIWYLYIINTYLIQYYFYTI